MNCVVTANEPLADGYFYLSLKPQKPVADIKPGQFFMVRCSVSFDPYLRRPMSVADYKADGSSFGFVIQKIGRGTRILSALVPDDRLDVIGPFGNGFDLTGDENNIGIVAGGTGVAPFIGLAESMPMDKRDSLTLYLGAKSSKFLLFEQRFLDLGIKVITATEDGSHGYKGFVTDALVSVFESKDINPPEILLTCGPTPMMRSVAKVAEERNIPCQVSLENQMACGFGACLGCVTKRKEKGDYVAVCRKGPVFDATTVEF